MFATGCTRIFYNILKDAIFRKEKKKILIKKVLITFCIRSMKIIIVHIFVPVFADLWQCHCFKIVHAVSFQPISKCGWI